MAKITKETIVQQIDVLKTTNVNSRFLQEQLAQKVETMEQEFDSSIVGLEDYNAEDLQQKMYLSNLLQFAKFQWALQVKLNYLPLNCTYNPMNQNA